MTYTMLKKILHRYNYVREKISNSRGLGKKFLPKINHPYPSPPQKSNGNHIGGGEEAGEFDTLVDVIRQQNGWLAFIMWWLLRVKVCISILKIRQ